MFAVYFHNLLSYYVSFIRSIFVFGRCNVPGTRIEGGKPVSFFREEFTAQSPAVRVRFGSGVRNSIADEIDALGARRALILTTPQQAGMADEFAALCG
ncbi:hypothetical protein O4J55_08205, partial [Paracoccus sp. PXZ]